ncbi:uncharacterized protein LOC144929009 isoform X2 [Branchiostoma floridae x Branchiostoma belcheri]
MFLISTCRQAFATCEPTHPETTLATGERLINDRTFPRDDWPWIAFYIYRPWEENVAIMKYTYWNVKVGEENSELNGIECVVNGQRFPIEVIVKACPIGQFGRFCAERCQCYNGAACHSFNGACRCAPGWTGRNCTTVHPEVRISPSTSELNDLRFGQELQLNCTSYNVRVNNFNWFLNGVPVNRSLLVETSDKSSSVLYIRSLLPKYEGHVTCEAGSVGGDQYTDAVDVHIATVTTRRTCFCVLSTCKNVGNRTASVRGEYHLRTESYGFGSTQTRRRTLSACNTFSTCGLRIYHPCVRVHATRVPRTAYERATYGLRESNFTILTCNCCTDSARSMCVPRTVLASSVLTPHFPVDLLNDHAEHTCTIPGAPHVQRTCNAPDFYSI